MYTQVRVYTVYHCVCIFRTDRPGQCTPRSGSTLFTTVCASFGQIGLGSVYPGQGLHCLPLCVHLLDR